LARRVGDSLKRAYEKMILRDDDDPTSMFYQACLHTFYCDNGWKGADIHMTWDFLPWHRAFLYFHERILGAACCNPHFRLPVWDWETCAEVPEVYCELGLPSFLKYPSRLPIRKNAKALFTDCILRGWLHSDSFEDFCGTGTGECPPGAKIGPHDAAHLRVMDGPMISPKTAAADPVFFAHHANVDRFWKYWLNYYKGFKKPGCWLAREYFLYDEQQRLVRVQPWQMLYESQLGYSYPTDPTVNLDVGSRAITPGMWACPKQILSLLQVLTLGTLRAGGQYSDKDLVGLLGANGSGAASSRLPVFPAKVNVELPSGLPQGSSYTVFVSREHGTPVAFGSFGVFGHTHNHGDTGCVGIPACFDANVQKLLGDPNAGALKLIWGRSGEEGREIVFSDNVNDNQVSRFELLYNRGAYEFGLQLVKSQSLSLPL